MLYPTRFRGGEKITEGCYLWAFLLQQPLTFAPLHGCIGITRVTTLLYFESSRVAWQDARQACQRIRGGDLVSIHSAAENDCIERHISG